MNTGDAIISAIVKGGIMHATCVHDKDHACLVTWSSGAAEQLEAIVNDNHMNAELKALEQELAYSAARADIESYCGTHEWSGRYYGTWYDPDEVAPDDVETVKTALRYLELRKLLTRNPESKNLIRPYREPRTAH